MNIPRSILLVVPLLVAVLPTRADTSFTATAWLKAVPVPGITVTNNSGQVSLKGNVHVVRIQADDLRVAGQLHAWMDLANQTNGTALFNGLAYSEVGTWDATGTNFTPSGGVWTLNYSGVAQADGSSQYIMAGYGIGGNIEGLRISVTMTRAAPGDPTTPYLASGMIKSAPVNTTALLDDFKDGVLKSQWYPWSPATPYLIETKDQLTVRGVWHQPPTDPVLDQAMAYWIENWSVPDGQTVEWRAEVLGMNQDVGWVGLAAGTGGTRFYGFGLGSDNVVLYRWTATGGNKLLFSDPATVKQTNIVLCFALTRHQSQAVVTMRVEDRAAPGTVLYQKIYLDVTPFLSGNNAALGIGPKLGQQSPDASASFDNFVRRTYEVPLVGIERAVRLTWPDTGMNFVVEEASSFEGPWLPVQNSENSGMQSITVPATAPMKIFRLQQAP